MFLGGSLLLGVFSLVICLMLLFFYTYRL